ncbi:probable RNA polymerase II nuclear localization protein SLC7A6OS [Uloborus diversus]|uniref:probable RNA polymerase II nuclear localization protein SLC7A6OS n=1 Tax=Uloborus diversus TaxID=327109 RepID=UPI00240A318D|nr:probable RNA polymerase II nuclear localization protein SLC7A6OS [Uloborus diversus]
MAAVLRVKRKASDEPADGLLIAVKKPKCSFSENVNEVLFKFAATLQSENESVKDHIQAVLTKERNEKVSKWRDPKTVKRNNPAQIAEKLKAEHKAANEKKKLDLLNNRRLIFTETVPFEEPDICQDTEVRKLFHLYDIIEENEDVKKQVDEADSIITCNGQPMIREKSGDYVFDVYIAEGHIDRSFVDSTVSVRPCNLTDDIYSGDSDDSDEVYDDEDDSNDENNWRNDYPDERSNSGKETDSESDDYDIVECHDGISDAFQNFDIDDDDSDVPEASFDYSRVLQELEDED